MLQNDLPKIHKCTLPFYSIVSNIGTAFYNLAHFLSQSLSHLTSNNLYMDKYCYDFADQQKMHLPPNYTMLSLDVIYLFTNVAIQGALDCLEKRFFKLYYSATKIGEILDFVN